MRLEREDFNRLDWGRGSKRNYNGGLWAPPGLLEPSKRVSSSDEDPEAWQVDPTQKTLTPGWEWYVYEKLSSDTMIDNLYIDLQHNTAKVNGVFNVPGSGRRYYTFFSCNRGDYLYGKSPRQGLYGPELLDIKTRVANRRRMVSFAPPQCTGFLGLPFCPVKSGSPRKRPFRDKATCCVVSGTDKIISVILLHFTA